VRYRRPPSPRLQDSRPDLFEALEGRLALYTSPLLADLPDPASMSNMQNTVVRLRTSEGNIDIELYDRFGPGGASAAPITTANFLSYINSGRYEETFFHRLIANFVLQGGGFSFTPPTTAAAVVTPADPEIQNEFDPGRSNVERTVAMAKRGDNPNSATSQFFFNLADNSQNLNNQNGGFTVFGKVIKGWEVVQTIAGFQPRDLNQFFTTNQGNFGEVPLSGSANTDLVTITDAEVIKPAEQTQFFSTALYYPEGFRSARITSSVSLLNEDVNGSVSYQIIARFENGRRDKVISSGTIVPGGHLTVPISQGGDPSINTVRPGTPFAYEIRATGPIAATLHHRDFGASAAEAFIDPMQLTADQLKDWTFAHGLKGPVGSIPSFLLWESLSGETATVTATFYSDTGQTFIISKSLEPFRRGGLSISEINGVPTGLFSVRVVSTQPLIATMSQYRSAPGRASMEQGMLEGGATKGLLPGAIIPSDGQALLSLLYTGASTSPVLVNITFLLSDGTSLQGAQQQLSTTTRRRDVDLTVLNGALPRNQFFTIRYGVVGNIENVTASYTSITAGDTMRTPFQSLSSSDIYFAGGFTNPAAGGREVLSLYNPFSDPQVTVTFRLRFQFVEDAQLDEVIFYPASGTQAIASNRRVDIDISTLTDIMSRINSAEKFRRYSITVETNITNGTSTIPGAIFGQLTRFAPNGEVVTYGPTLSHTLAPLPVKNPGFVT
jgi:peptidyl-prolyl cis-trans isomerase A (cyclophilin A)